MRTVTTLPAELGSILKTLRPKCFNTAVRSRQTGLFPEPMQ